MQNLLKSDLFENIIFSMNDVLNNFINSNKLDFIGNLHQQIIYGVDNGNTVYNWFEIDSNIIKNYKL